jgi:hypothetical protein
LPGHIVNIIPKGGAKKLAIRQRAIISAVMSCIKVMMVTITTTSFIVYIISLPDSTAYFTGYAVSDPQRYIFYAPLQALSMDLQGEGEIVDIAGAEDIEDIAGAEDIEDEVNIENTEDVVTIAGDNDDTYQSADTIGEEGVNSDTETGYYRGEEEPTEQESLNQADNGEDMVDNS